MGYNHIILCFNAGDISKFQHSFLQRIYTVVKLSVLFLVIFTRIKVTVKVPETAVHQRTNNRFYFRSPQKDSCLYLSSFR
jgi:hypothetical protein